ncbi:putative Integral membrane sensor signal transduction histidine kinase [Streptomyces viridochromogenes Tue57]|uniref:Putative Integral membrane sensor signal transduction histidine kinase n=1 Tax=Streptomyces viridochromogenes Tue57 TaxID=1160705 RepID=L8PMG7_STRVR|nr:putative Integral membrane sensor signal transduction histidine kinase [Streptomyces viridochromogenes Tue57]
MTQATGVAALSLALLVTGSLTLLAVDVLAQPISKGTLVTGLILLILLPAVLLGQYAPPPYRLPYRWRWGLLGLQALLTYLPVLVFEYKWLSLLGFLAGAVLLTVPRPASLVIAVAVAASGPLLVHSSLVDTRRGGMSILVSTVITGSSVYAVMHLALLAARLQASHSQAARLAEHRERARIAQDLHDLVGSSLVSIAVQSEIALRRTPASSPGHQALSDIAMLARRAHAEVRGIAADSLSAHLHTELAHAQRLLSQAGIVTHTTLPPRVDLPEPASACLGAVLREGIGNVLQHSQAARCDIEVRVDQSRVRLRLDNNGALPTPEVDRSGSGLVNLRLRTLALGGTLEAEARGDSFVLTAELPLDPSVPLGDTDRVHEGAGV